MLFIVRLAITASYGGIYAVIKCKGVLVYAQGQIVRKVFDILYARGSLAGSPTTTSRSTWDSLDFPPILNLKFSA
jgi:hypothetical protein